MPPASPPACLAPLPRPTTLQACAAGVPHHPAVQAVCGADGPRGRPGCRAAAPVYHALQPGSPQMPVFTPAVSPMPAAHPCLHMPRSSLTRLLQAGLEVGGVYTLGGVIPKQPPVGAKHSPCSILSPALRWHRRRPRVARPTAASRCCALPLSLASERRSGPAANRRPTCEALSRACNSLMLLIMLARAGRQQPLGRGAGRQDAQAAATPLPSLHRSSNLVAP